jgi:hypothetical protein
MNPVERRAWPRTDAIYQIAYECFNAYGHKIDTGMAQTVNISGHGALIEMPRGVDPGTSMILWITAPFHTLLVKGNVVHSHVAANGLFCVGVRLTDVIEGSWDTWAQIGQRG